MSIDGCSTQKSVWAGVVEQMHKEVEALAQTINQLEDRIQLSLCAAPPTAQTEAEAEKQPNSHIVETVKNWTNKLLELRQKLMDMRDRCEL